MIVKNTLGGYPMTEKERKHLGAWSTNLPAPKFNDFRMCLINLWKKHKGTNITVSKLLDLALECVEEKGGDTDEIEKVIGLYKGEFIEIQDLEEFKEEKKDMSFKVNLSPTPTPNG